MAFSEFDLIKKFFAGHADRPDVVKGVGDDAAILEVPPNHQLVVTTDTLIEGVHFPEQTSAQDIGHKALAVNLSDIAAMGAEPAWATLSLSLPHYDQNWLTDFAKGFLELASQFNVALVGGDTVSGPLSITVQMHGLIPRGTALMRSGAQVNDLVYVTGTLGDAGLALKNMLEHLSLEPVSFKRLREHLDRPTPRIMEGIALRDMATACIDISDGLFADLNHICEESSKGAEIHLEKLPLSSDVEQYIEKSAAWDIPLSSGDDYELCFTVPENKSSGINVLFATLGVRCTCIGRITDTGHIRVLDKNNKEIHINKAGYDHFKK